MERGLLRTSLNGSALVALLSQLQLAPVDGPLHVPPFVEGLGGWLGWTDAIALAAALNAPPNADDGPGAAKAANVAALAALAAPVEAELARVRAALGLAIEDDGAPAGNRRQSDRSALAAHRPSVADHDFPPHRQRYLGLQQAMESRIGPLRAQARAAVARGSAALNQLAVLDAVLDRALGARQQALLATLPSLLEKHFARLRRSPSAVAGSNPGSASDGPSPSGEWLNGFRRDMQRMLHAELELRLQPVQGLLEALRTTPQRTHA